jgi:hypothetical protein
LDGVDARTLLPSVIVLSLTGPSHPASLAAVLHCRHYMTNLLSQDSVVKEKMDEMKLGEFSSMVGASTLLTWKEAISVPQQGS